MWEKSEWNIQNHKTMKIREARTIKTPLTVKKEEEEEGERQRKKYIHVHELFTWNVAIVSSGKENLLLTSCCVLIRKKSTRRKVSM